ncbi:4Fe-4S binding protein [Paludibacterium paludis]|uniref:4Fe-4S binding domain-containing protein n=1 Tax=Paludibacterium paludis TaxID=1225769 RepID=A0A918UAC1_9NEIS|nr:4Fe-4S binding protein [Paludibacterium paludis]GGY16712.1 4Fe-4S binding domain-containing protein [Paludibacterium paludis]
MRMLLARCGDWLRDHGPLLRKLQWVVVFMYLGLLVVPAVMPLPPDSARILDNITVFAQFVFWGIWWPFVLLSMVLFGRLWCGVLCPEGAMTEWAARRGLGLPIPRWMRWGGWPFVAFACTTVFGQMVSVYQYPKAALLVLGGSTVAAVIIGFLYTRGKRAWCRHLCPVNGVFALLSKLAPFHYRVDEAAWKASLSDASGRKVIPVVAVDCAPLMPLRHMKGAGGCHMCGRCSGHRGAISLAARAPNREVVEVAGRETDPWQSALILFGLLGIALGAFHWTVSDIFIAMKQASAEWLVERDILWPLDDGAPWWLLTHYPEHNDSFTWLDGGVLIAFIGGFGLVSGTLLSLLVALAARFAGPWEARRFHHLAQSLIPMAGCSVFLGLSSLTVTLIKAEGLPIGWTTDLRAGLLGGAVVWSLWLAARILRHGKSGWRGVPAMLPMIAALGLLAAFWSLQFGWIEL